jgi:hypothetical protein
VNGDRSISPIDALLVIDDLNASSAVADQPEGESTATDSFFGDLGSDRDSSADELWSLLATDTENQGGRKR